MSIEVEVVDAPLDYNLLLGHNWIYNMRVVVYSIFCVILFPFKDWIVMIEQQSFDNSRLSALSGSIIPVIDNSKL